MLHKQKSKKTAILKYGMFVPLFGLTLILSSATIRQNENIRVAAESIPLDQPLTAVADALPAAVTKSISGPETPMLHANKSLKQEKLYDFTSIDNPPVFPGGMEKFYSFIGKSIRYPQEAVKNNVQGKVFLSFIVEKDGSLSHINVDKGLGSETDEEAVRVLESSPRWAPGLKNKQPVRVKYNMPISFALSNPKASEKGQLPANVIYTIDGKNVTSEEAQSLAPNTIESINVIKAANAPHAEGTIVKKDMIIIKTKAAKGDSTTVSPGSK